MRHAILLSVFLVVFATKMTKSSNTVVSVTEARAQNVGKDSQDLRRGVQSGAHLFVRIVAHMILLSASPAQIVAGMLLSVFLMESVISLMLAFSFVGLVTESSVYRARTVLQIQPKNVQNIAPSSALRAIR